MKKKGEKKKKNQLQKNSNGPSEVEKPQAKMSKDIDIQR